MNETIRRETIRVAGDSDDEEMTWNMAGLVPEGLCPQCAVEHDPETPHFRESLHYQAVFYAEHHRRPTWSDTMAHCDDETKRRWSEALCEHGVTI